MLTNTDCTLYLTEDGKTYRRVYCPACHWEDSVRVFLPLSAADLAGVKGYLVRGACAFYQSSDHPIRELVTQGNALTVTSAARCDFGSLTLHHWEVYAK